MNKDQKFIKIEIEYIETAKFFEGIRLNKDPGNQFVYNWIKDNAKNFRLEWEESKCQHCQYWKECGHLVRKECDEFIFDNNELN